MQPSASVYVYRRIQIEIMELVLNSSSCNAMPENKQISIRSAFDEIVNSQSAYYKLNKQKIIDWFSKCFPFMNHIAYEKFCSIDDFKMFSILEDGFVAIMNVISEFLVNHNSLTPIQGDFSLEIPWFSYQMVNLKI